ncbi:Energy-conserving hydrogenase (ferredoxin), subunit D [Methanosarcina barkeri str. Wiesmoor]|uniref:Energy-conserving hydrogenase (Ferredoxin), subunit D n=3 Tax=Methanosarcina barkeri TaxID=2208 RepID=A0A0E3LKT9_METBA|nr:NADH-quinone oxidoreductase subunit C [Methanosarcina barkeri]AKB50101.1 Energy-conserving hydrogenase (ferredoxin), subunit D [Methanosarcina barkeri str. Wiesmoor]CAA76120.1 echD [Methanosarcina barkeri]
MLENEVEIKNSDELLKTVEGLKNDGYRNVTMICLKANEGHEFIYVFEKDYQLKNLRYFLKPGEKPKSISGIYLCALLIENEYQDLFGLTFEGLAIDYKGHLYLTPNSPKAPLA